MKKENKKKNSEEEIDVLKKKRERSEDEISDEEDEEEENNYQNKKKKIEIKNYLNFSQNQKNNLNNIISKKNDLILLSKKTNAKSSKNKYNYFCQEITSGNNSIIINDAKILILENKTLLFLLSTNILYIFEIKENKIYEFIKEITLDQQNSFDFTHSPINIYLLSPQDKKSKKAQNQKNNTNKKIRTKMVVYLSIISCKERYLCKFDLKNLIFKQIKNIVPKKGLRPNFSFTDMKIKFYKNNKFLCYDKDCAYVQRIYGAPRYTNLKKKNIESVTLLNENLLCICTPNMVYIYETNNETIIGDFETNSTGKKAKLIKPDNNLLLVYSSTDVALYDLDSLMIFQKLELNNINNTDEPIKKVKQLNNNNIAILFSSIFAIYNLEKNKITFKYNYWNSDICKNNMNNVLIEINPNVTLVNNDQKNFYIINCIKGDKIASLNINNNNFSLCKKIKKYVFKYGVTQDKNIEENNNDSNGNYVLMNNNQNTFILNSIKEE